MQPSPDQIRRDTFRSLGTSFDVLIIGGGATGLGIALDAATRGYHTALIEAGDFAQATSSRSTKLVHGGVRYLASGQIHLVREALVERAIMRKNAPHLVHPLPTVLPAQHIWELPYYGAGLFAYDRLSGSSSMGPTKILSRKSAIDYLPGIAQNNLVGGVMYHDAQFNDARFALATARSAIQHGATILNYVRCTRFLYTNPSRSRIRGATAKDIETGEEVDISATVTINASGIFSDETRNLDQPGREKLLSVSRGSHIVIPSRFLGGLTAMMIPKTEDGRVIFAIPWEGVVLIGTTDIHTPTSIMEPNVDSDEIDYLLRHIGPYLSASICREDILSIFSGLRPLVTGREKTTSKLSREHHIDISKSGMITVAGGKWTTYRRMAEDTLNFAIHAHLLPHKDCITRDIPLHGYPQANKSVFPSSDPYLAEYGTDAADVTAIEQEDPTLHLPIDSSLPYTKAMVLFAVRYELARTVEDVLSRRTRALLLNAVAAMRAAPFVAAIMAKQLQRDSAWQEQQITAFRELAQRHYLA